MSVEKFPVKEKINAFEELLKLSKREDIEGVAFVALCKDGSALTGWDNGITEKGFASVGAFEFLKSRFIAEVFGCQDKN